MFNLVKRLCIFTTSWRYINPIIIIIIILIFIIKYEQLVYGKCKQYKCW